MAGTGSATWTGVSLPVPGVYPFINASALGFPAAAAAPNVYLIGYAAGGKPNTVLGPFTSLLAASQTLQAGDLLDGVRYALKGGATQVYVYRPYTALQSSLTLRDSSSNPSVAITSVDYGNWTNSLLCSVAGTSDNLVLTIQDNYHNTSPLISPALGGGILLSYTGNASTAGATIIAAQASPTVAYSSTATTGGSIPASTTVYVRVVPRNASGQGLVSSEESSAVGSSTSTNTITFAITAQAGSTSYDIYASDAADSEVYYGNVLGAESGSVNFTLISIPSGTAPYPTTATDGPELTVWLSGDQTDGSQSLDISLDASNVSTLRGLSAYLNGQIGYTAVLQVDAGTIDSDQLDQIATESILNDGYMLTSGIGACVNWLNSTGIVTAAAASGATSPPAVVGLTPFAGGSDGTTTGDAWSTAAAQILTYPQLLRYPVALTSTASYQQNVNTGVVAAGTPPETDLCEGFYGGAIGETTQTARQNANALNNRRAIYCGQADFTDQNSNFVLTSYPGYMFAAYVAGIRAGQAPTMPLTGKAINVVAMNQILNTTTISTLNAAGVLCATVSNQGQITISLGTTTDTSAADYNNLYYVEESVGNAVDSVAMYLIQQLTGSFVGQQNFGALTTQTILSSVNALLATLQSTYQWISGYDPASTVTPLSSNPTFSVVPITLYIVSPINGLILPISLQMPLQTAASST